MAHRSQSSSVGDNPLDPNYLPPHYREEYRLAIDALVEDDLQGYYEFIQKAEVVDFLSQPEIDHIKSTIKVPNQASTVPELPYHTEAPEEDGSSDTYWPMHSDTAAPGLDLGWPPQQHSFIGPTEVTTLVNPSDPDMPSIKEQARRLIKRAQHVIAVVMDMFTDVDIFADLLDAAARHVPVYILLDEHNAHHFVSMVNSCKVNLDLIHMMRVRTVAGVTYFCRTGKSFKGQVKDRFLLADCRAVLSGNYSFMWSYEKLHRCIAHLFLGELVTTFDEEFRILFAQSQPLTIDNALVLHSGSETSSTSSYFGMKRTQSMRNPRGFLRQPELPAAYPFPGAGDSDRNLFRREDPYRHTMDVSAGLGKFVSSQQFRMQQSFLEQGRSMVSRQMEMSSNAYKRHSYAEGTQESYSSSKQYMKHRVMNNLEETEQHYHREQSQSSHYFQSDGNGQGLGHRQQDRLRGKVPPHLALDHYSDPGYPLELEAPTPPDSYGRDYLSSADLRDDPGHIPPPAGGMYGGGSTQKRPSVGQPYACQSSPTHPHPPEKPGVVAPKEQPDRSQDPSVKQGMRSWRINSYLSTYEDGGEEGLPQPMGPDAFEDPPREPPNAPRPDLKPRYGKPILPDYKEAGPTTTTRDLSGMDRPSALGMERERGGEREVGVDVGDGQEVGLSKHESFRMRVNPQLQRSSRLRSSLIFSSSKLETHSGGLGLKTATEEDEELDPLRTTSIVAQILEKRRSMSREPFEWRKKAEEKEKEKEEAARLKEESKPKEEPLKTIKEAPKNPPAEEEKPKVTLEPPKPAPVMNMNDPASRLQYFKDLAAKRKLSKIEAESTLRGPEPTQKKPDLSDTPPPSTTPSVPKGPCLSVIPPDPAPKKPETTSSTLTGPISRHSVTSSKPPTIQTRPCLTQPKPSELSPAPAPAPAPTPAPAPAPAPAPREDSSSEPQRKEPTKSLKPLPSPKFFKRDALLNPFKSSSNVRTVSCGEEILNTDATDTEKSEQKKMRSHSSSSMTRPDYKGLGSNSSLNQLGGAGETKAETKPLDFLKKQTQRLKGFLGPKDKKSASSAAASGDDKTMSTVPEITEDSAGSSTANHKALAGVKVGPSRYQTSTSVLFSSNLRDDTKVILEQISANSQQRLEREEAGGQKVSDAGQEKGSGGLEKQSSLRRNRLFVRPQPNPQEREGLLQRIESMRKEKKVYSRFEMGNNLG